MDFSVDNTFRSPIRKKPKMKSVIFVKGSNSDSSLVKTDDIGLTNSRKTYEPSALEIEIDQTELDSDNSSLKSVTNYEANFDYNKIMSDIYASCFYCPQTKTAGWVLDSGATIHMTHDRSLFTKFDPKGNGKIRIADGRLIKVEGIGTIKMLIKTKDEPLSLILNDVRYVPAVQANLMSVNRLTESNYKILFHKRSAQIEIRNEFINFANFYGGSYIVNEDECPKATLCIDEWHRLLAHRNLRDIKHLQSFGLNFTKCNCTHECEPCKLGKLTEFPYPKASPKPDKVLDIISADVCGPLPVETPEHQRFFLTITDHFSDYTEVKYLKQKSEAKLHIKNFIEFTKNQLNQKPKIFRTDRGTEFLDAELKNYLASEGIEIQHTTPYSPQQNGVAERKNRTLNDAVRTMLISSDLPQTLWAEAMKNAVYTFNRIVRKKKNATPIELFFNKKAKATFVEFGTEVYVMTQKHERSKFDPHGKLVKFLSVDDNSKGFRLWNGKKIFVDRNVATKRNQKILYKSPLSNVDLKVNAENVEQSQNNVVSSPRFEPPLRRSNRLAQKETAKLAMITNSPEEDPSTYKKAMNSANKDKWILAMHDEINSLNDTGTIEIVDPPKNKTLVGCRWLYKTKIQPSGNRFKARLVAQGFSQQYGLDYDQVFAPVVRPASIRLLLSIAGTRKLSVRQFDVQTAFLNGNLKEEIYMKMPEGMQEENKVIRLHKAIYGLKQAARSWNEKLNESMMSIGFIQSEADDCLFILKQGTNRCYVVCHVDDMIVAATKSSIIDEVYKRLNKLFTMKDLGHVSQFLGVEVHKTKSGNYAINQKSYIEKISTLLNVSNSRPQKYPIDPNFYNIDRGEALNSNSEFRKIIGMLLYIATNTRPDISASVCILAQRVEKPHTTDLNEALRIVKYVNGTKDHKLVLSDTEASESLVAYSDANWAEDKLEGKSNSGLICFINGGPIIWRCKKQTNVALSTCEAEYYAATETAKEVLWLKTLMNDFEINSERTTPIYVDNQSCISMISTGDFKQRTKYIGVKYHFLRDYVNKEIFNLVYVPSEKNIADLLTKPLNSVKIKSLRNSAGLKDK